MTMRYNHPIIVDQIMRDLFESLEGFRSHPYMDTHNYWTIGIGHNLTQNPLQNYIKFAFWPPKDEDDRLPTDEEVLVLLKRDGITKEQAYFILNGDIVDSELQLWMQFTRFSKLDDDTRKIAVLYMCFNLGIRGTLGFHKFCDHFSHKRFDDAADEIVNSQWYKQVPRAAKCIEHMVRHGTIPEIYKGS